MTNNNEKRKINSWLVDSEFLKKSGYMDSYYLESLCVHVSNFLKNAPIPILTTWDNKNFRIYFTIGSDVHYLPVDNQVHPYDFITLLKDSIKSYYPKYTVIEKRERSLSEEEILAKVKNEGMDLNDAINYIEVYDYEESAIIEKVFFVKDEFLINVDGQKSIRMSGTIKKLMPIRQFMKDLRECKTDEERKEFIFSNSTLVKNLGEGSHEEIKINYSGKMLVNFFKINQPFIQGEPKAISTFVYKWGNFIITFESHLLKDDCLALFKKEDIEAC